MYSARQIEQQYAEWLRRAPAKHGAVICEKSQIARREANRIIHNALEALREKENRLRQFLLVEVEERLRAERTRRSDEGA